MVLSLSVRTAERKFFVQFFLYILPALFPDGTPSPVLHGPSSAPLLATPHTWAIPPQLSVFQIPQELLGPAPSFPQRHSVPTPTNELYCSFCHTDPWRPAHSAHDAGCLGDVLSPEPFSLSHVPSSPSQSQPRASRKWGQCLVHLSVPLLSAMQTQRGHICQPDPDPCRHKSLCCKS